ncbi:MAG: hypothetical protein JW996_01330, partial [Candidatus Cloacimonetes bacterium]|nr:hypothetical protein [Candidatus Cloacimonadota bacterium]
MKNILKIYRVMLRHWGYLISGLLFMLGFAFFSGISITLAIPLFDYVFADNKVEILYRDFSSFYHALSHAVITFFQNLPDIKEIFHKETLIQLADLLKEVLIKTDPILLLWVISFSIISLVILKNFFFYGNKVLFANLHGKTIKDIRNKIFKKYLYESLNFFSQNRVGDSLVRMISDVKIISTMFIKSAFRVLQDFILLIVNT